MTKSTNNKSIDNLLEECEKIGTVNSPSSTHTINMMVLESAERRKLRGQYVCLAMPQDKTLSYVLGHITEVEMSNPSLEKAGWAGIVKTRGAVYPISERLDLLRASMRPSAVFTSDGNGGFTTDMLGIPPHSGIPISLTTNGIIEKLTAKYEDKSFYMGKFYLSDTRLPLTLQHFGDGEDGASDAYHIICAGPTGSGKSTFAKMMITAYSRYPQMAIFIIDPVGEFSRNARGEKGNENFFLNLKQMFEHHNKPVKIINAYELRLDRWKIFIKLLTNSEMLRNLLSVKGEPLLNAVRYIEDELSDKFTLGQLHEKTTFESVLNILQDEEFQELIYKSKPARAGFVRRLQFSEDRMYKDWLKITELFRGDREGVMTVDQLLNIHVFNKDTTTRPVVIVDVSEKGNRDAMKNEETGESYWNDTVQAIIIKRLLDGIKDKGFDAWQNKEGSLNSLNTLVVVDEAQRLTGEGKIDSEEDKEVRDTLIDAADTTRKFGLGWMFVGTALSGIDERITRNVRIWALGTGFIHGGELERMKQLLPDQGDLELYKSFKDPNSNLDRESREFSFVLRGPISPLGQLLFMTAFNNVDEFLQTNKL
jgi:hypothetical protein